MFVQSLFLRTGGAWSDIYLFWAALLGWLIVMGPGPFSFDRLLSRGAGTSAVPGVAPLRRAYCCVTLRLGQVAIRVWLAAAPAGAAFAATGMSSPMQRSDVAAWLPHVPGMVALLPPSISLLLATLLALGFGTRLAALVLLVMVPISQISLPVDDRLYWLLLLATLTLHGPGRFSLDGWLGEYLAALGKRFTGVDADLPHVVIIGGGFGGIAAARGLRRAPCRITLIDEKKRPSLPTTALSGRNGQFVSCRHRDSDPRHVPRAIERTGCPRPRYGRCLRNAGGAARSGPH